MRFYTPKGDTSAPATMSEWDKWIATNPPERRIASDRFGIVWIQTGFCGIDQRVFPEGHPKLWRTYVFGLNPPILDALNPPAVPDVTESMTRAEAEQAHLDIVARVQQELTRRAGGQMELEAS